MLTHELYGGGFKGKIRSAPQSHHAHILNGVIEKSRDVVGEEEVDGGRDKGLKSVGGGECGH